jgi:hypothetical protein
MGGWDNGEMGLEDGTMGGRDNGTVGQWKDGRM